MKNFNLKKEKVLPIIGLIFIVLGIVVFSGGKPDSIDPKVLNPTWESMLAGLLLCLIGWLVGHKHFKNYLDDPNIRWIRYNLIESYK